MTDMMRLLLFLLGTVSFRPAGPPRQRGELAPAAPGASSPADPAAGAGTAPEAPSGPPPAGSRRRRLRRRLILGGVAVLAAVIFRRALAALAVAALSGALHLVGITVHLPRITPVWPWQQVSAGRVSNADVGPMVLEKIEGISRPALGQANFTFVFTHRVSKDIGPLPCWYASTFYAVGRASATVDLNPGAAWWAPAAGHFRLRVLARPAAGSPGQVAVTIVLPRPQLPQSVHEVSIDDLPSRPLSTQHSWTYPGLGCGVLIRPQFAQSVLYAQAQRIAFYRASHVAAITRPLIAAAETQATRTIRDGFLQPALNAVGYSLAGFSVSWAAGQAG